MVSRILLAGSCIGLAVQLQDEARAYRTASCVARVLGLRVAHAGRRWAIRPANPSPPTLPLSPYPPRPSPQATSTVLAARFRRSPRHGHAWLGFGLGLGLGLVSRLQP